MTEIVDLHRHLWSIFERYPSVYDPHLEDPEARPAGHDAAAYLRRSKETIEEMDESKVDVSVVFLGDYGLRLKAAGDDVLAENRAHAQIARGSKGRLVAFYGVDPRREDAITGFEAAVRERAVGGLKLHPGAGFLPSDACALPFFELAGDHDIPVAVHTGPMAAPLLSHPGQPIHLDSVAAEFPKTKIIMQHAGQSWWPEALNIAFWKPTIFLELSMWQWTLLHDEEEFVRALWKMKRTIGCERILFGSDLPGLRSAMSLRRWVDTFQDLPVTARKYGADFSDADIELILGGNALRLLGIHQ